ncbi:cyclic GMP-AMP synthase-like receptor 1 [Glandiceps talaboti]
MATVHDELSGALNNFTKVKIETSRQGSRKAISLCLEYAVKPILTKIAEIEPRFKADPPLATSSYFEGLRVSATNEFEFLVSLVHLLSFRGYDDVGHRDPKYGCYGYLVAKHSNYDIADLVEATPTTSKSKGYTGLGVLSACRVKRVFFDLVKRAVDNLPKSPNKQVEVKVIENVDDIPVLSITADGETYSIELVPCIPFQAASDWPPSAVEWGKETNEWLTPNVIKEVKKFGFHLLPKSCPIDPEDKNLWRLSFSRSEKFLLQHADADSVNGRRKQCERILKTMREAHRDVFAPVVSYHIKTIFLHECMKFSSGSDWTKDKLEERFNGLLRSMIYALEKGQCPHFFIAGCNLYAHYGSESLNKAASVLRDILGSLSNQPANSKYLQ